MRVKDTSRFGDLVKEYIRRYFPDISPQASYTYHAQFIHHIDEIFGEIFQYAKYAKRYRLKRVIKRAYQVFNQEIHVLLGQQTKPLLQQAMKIYHEDAEKTKVRTLFDALERVIEHKEQSLVYQSRYLRMLLRAIDVLDVIIPVGLIMILSVSLYHYDTVLKNILTAVGFLAATALIKVMLDRFVVVPWIDHLGWKMYVKLLKTFKRVLALTQAIIIAVQVSCKAQKTDDQQLLQTLSHALNILQKKL